MLLLVTSTEPAAAGVAERLDQPAEVEVGGVPGVRGHWADVDVAVHALGVGRASAAFTLARLLADPPRATILVGSGPAYPATGLTDGELVVATADTYAELGQEGPGGLRDIASLGVRVAPGAPGQTFLCDPRLVDALGDRAHRAGPFLTAETRTTTVTTATGLVQRWGPALTESREGAATAHVCLLESVPMGHLRAVRGEVGRDGGANDPEGPLPAAATDAVERALPGIATALAHPFS